MVRILHPISESSTGLFENNPDKSSVERFRFFHADEGKPLATPWQVAISRAIILREYPLAEGIILDCACGSGIQAAAYSEILKRSIVGIELNESRARASAVNFRTVFTLRGNTDIERINNSYILIGDGRNGTEIITCLNTIRPSSDKVAFLHLDPARPRNSREHSLSEMAPRLDEVFDGWHKHLVETENGPAILLDLSPRISTQQMIEVESLVDSYWPNVCKTWTWTSRGRGRVDRLALWIGAIADTGFARRFVRIPPKPAQPPIIMTGGLPISESSMPIVKMRGSLQRGHFVSIVDAALVESGLADDWLSTLSIAVNYEWLECAGRRPLIYHADRINESKHELANLIVASGRIVDFIDQELSAATIDEFVELSLTHDISKLTIRAGLNPRLQPQLQGSLDRQLSRRHGSREAFLLGNPNGKNYLICIVN